MLALRAELRKRGVFNNCFKEPNLASLLDLVALGYSSRCRCLTGITEFWSTCLHRILAMVKPGTGIYCIVAQSRKTRLSTYLDERAWLSDWPTTQRSRSIDDMTLGIECLITDDEGRAIEIASELDRA